MKLKQSSKGKVGLWKPKAEIKPVQDEEEEKTCKERWLEVYENLRELPSPFDIFNDLGALEPNENWDPSEYQADFHLDNIQYIPEEIWCKLLELWRVSPDGLDEPWRHPSQDSLCAQESSESWVDGIEEWTMSVEKAFNSEVTHYSHPFFEIRVWISHEMEFPKTYPKYITSIFNLKIRMTHDTDTIKAQYEKILGIINGILND